SNYIGAAVSRSKMKIVWWTKVGDDGAAGDFYYIYNYGSGWNGPVVTSLAPYNYISYIHSAFADNDHLEILGHMITGKYQSASRPGSDQERHKDYVLAAKLKIGSKLPINDILSTPDLGIQVWHEADIWVDPTSKDVHALAMTNEGGSAYFFRPAADSWSGHTASIALFENGYRARFIYTNSGRFFVVKGAYRKTGGDFHNGGVKLLELKRPQPGTTINWEQARDIPLSPPSIDMGIPSAIWVEAPIYQTNQFISGDFAVSGTKYIDDNQIWQTEINE
ncbi:MAG: hypothetical protein AABZ06_11785, partial [Bdellovibrionota bacterium]